MTTTLELMKRVVLIGFINLTATAVAQSDDIIESKEATIYENRIEKYLSKYLHPNKYDVDVNLKFKKIYLKTRKFKFMDTFFRGKESLSHSRRFISTFELTIYFTDQVPAITQETLRQMMLRKLTKFGLKPTISVEKLPIEKEVEINPENQRLLEELSLARNQINISTTKEALLAKEINDLKDRSKNDINNLKEKFSEQKDGLQGQITNLKDKLKETNASMIKRYLDITPLGTVIVIGIIVFGLFISRLASYNLKSAAALAESITSIASSISGVSQNISETKKREEKAKTETAKSSEKKIKASKTSPEFAAKRLIELRESIVASLDDVGEAKILEHLVKTIMHDNNLEEAFLTIELLGEEEAFKLYSKLGNSARQKLSKFIEDGAIIEDKTDKSVQLGEYLMTILMSTHLAKNFEKRNSNISKLLLNVDPEDLSSLLQKLPKEFLPRLLYHLPSEDISHFYTQSFHSSEQDFSENIILLNKIPVEGLDPEHDDKIISALEKEIGIAESPPIKLFFSSYVQILDRLSEEAKSKAVAVMGAENPDLKRFLDSHIVTFHTLFLLPQDEFEACLQNLSNESYAILSLSLQGDQKERVLSMVPERQMEMITEEIDIIANKPDKYKAKILERTKSQIVDQIKLLMEGNTNSLELPNAG